MILEESGVKEGIVIISPLHTTSSVFVNDDEEGLLQDTLEFLESMIPTYKVPYYRHNQSDKGCARPFKAECHGAQRDCLSDGRAHGFGKLGADFLRGFPRTRKKKICVKVMGE